MTVERLHHVAYRCTDARETVDFYETFLDLEFAVSIAENIVPSTGERYPHIHIFLEMADGGSVAFFELPESEEMTPDPNTPDWVRHLALKVENRDALLNYKQRLQEGGHSVLGPIDHSFCESIYFHDPSGHRLELTVDTGDEELHHSLRSSARSILDHWDEHRVAPDVDPLHANARDGGGS